MPEMPEVETIRRDLAGQIKGQKIKAVQILFAKTAKNPAAFFKKALLGKSFLSLERRGKLLIFKISSGSFLLIHLKMTGQLIYWSQKIKLAGGHSLSEDSFISAVGGKLPGKHTRLIIEFKNGARLFFNDIRKFGYLKIVSATELASILENNYGPEPLTREFSIQHLQEIFSRRKIKIKALLLNQKLIAGLGNIYVDEALFAARLHPERLANTLKLPELKKLQAEINRIIKIAINKRGTTFSNYVDASGRQGNFFSFLQVYGRAGEDCPNCGRPLSKQKIAGRGTHYCAYCQK